MTDPAVRSRARNYGPTDISEKGIESFFANHTCNQFCNKHGTWLRPSYPQRSFPQSSATSMFSSSVSHKLQVSNRTQFCLGAMGAIVEEEDSDSDDYWRKGLHCIERKSSNHLELGIVLARNCRNNAHEYLVRSVVNWIMLMRMHRQTLHAVISSGKEGLHNAVLKYLDLGKQLLNSSHSKFQLTFCCRSWHFNSCNSI